MAGVGSNFELESALQPTPLAVPASQTAPRVLLALTGSVASIKALELFEAFETEGWSVKIVATESALHFVRTVLPTLTPESPSRKSPESPEPSSAAVGPSNVNHLEARFQRALHTDDDEWAWKGRGDPVLHIELRKWADVLVIAPLDANTLAKLANGLSDNLLTCIVRAWEFSPVDSITAQGSGPATRDAAGGGINSPVRRSACKKPIVLAPAMNTAMWDHPFTMKHLQTVVDIYGGGSVYVEGSGWDGSGVAGVIDAQDVGKPSRRLTVVSPVAKVLACGDVGVGAMAAIPTIVEAVKKAMS